VSERFSELEGQVSSSFSIRPGKVEDEIESQEEGLENLRLAFEKLRASVTGERN
jgi:hypothetical protein